MCVFTKFPYTLLTSFLVSSDCAFKEDVSIVSQPIDTISAGKCPAVTEWLQLFLVIPHWWLDRSTATTQRSTGIRCSDTFGVWCQGCWQTCWGWNCKAKTWASQRQQESDTWSNHLQQWHSTSAARAATWNWSQTAGAGKAHWAWPHTLRATTKTKARTATKTSPCIGLPGFGRTWAFCKYHFSNCVNLGSKRANHTCESISRWFQENQLFLAVLAFQYCLQNQWVACCSFFLKHTNWFAIYLKTQDLSDLTTTSVVTNTLQDCLPLQPGLLQSRTTIIPPIDPLRIIDDPVNSDEEDGEDKYAPLMTDGIGLDHSQNDEDEDDEGEDSEEGSGTNGIHHPLPGWLMSLFRERLAESERHKNGLPPLYCHYQSFWFPHVSTFFLLKRTPCTPPTLFNPLFSVESYALLPVTWNTLPQL